MSLISREAIYGVCDQVRIISVNSTIEITFFNVSALETSWNIENLYVATRHKLILSRKQLTKGMTRLRPCASWFALLVYTDKKIRFSSYSSNLSIESLHAGQYFMHLLTFKITFVIKKIYWQHYQSVKWFGYRSGLTLCRS